VTTAEIGLPTDELLQLGPIRLRLAADVPDFAALAYFGRHARAAPGGAPDHELICLSASSPAGRRIRAEASDDTARARGFAAGYYVTDHFGPPVHLVTRGRRCYVVGERLEHVVWPYFVKHLLQRHAVAAGGLFLTAAALATGGAATLVIGRGGGGKTVLVGELCRGGADFVTNSHAVVQDGQVRGVASSLRIRRGPWLDALGVAGRPALNPAEVVVDPADAFPAVATQAVPVRAICVADYRGHDGAVRELDPDASAAVLEQFGLGLNVYRLEEDLLDDLGGDYAAFAAAYQAMRRRLRRLAGACRTYLVSADVTRPERRDELLTLLKGA
jgi:hypothetical protein